MKTFKVKMQMGPEIIYQDFEAATEQAALDAAREHCRNFLKWRKAFTTQIFNNEPGRETATN